MLWGSSAVTNERSALGLRFRYEILAGKSSRFARLGNGIHESARPLSPIGCRRKIAEAES